MTGSSEIAARIERAVGVGVAQWGQDSHRAESDGHDVGATRLVTWRLGDRRLELLGMPTGEVSLLLYQEGAQLAAGLSWHQALGWMIFVPALEAEKETETVLVRGLLEVFGEDKHGVPDGLADEALKRLVTLAFTSP